MFCILISRFMKIINYMYRSHILQIYICNHHYVYNCFKSGSSCKDYIRRVSDMIWVMSFHYWLERIYHFIFCLRYRVPCHWPISLLTVELNYTLPSRVETFFQLKNMRTKIWLYILTHSTSIVSRFWWLESIKIYLRIITSSVN